MGKMSREIDLIVVHCSATNPSQNIGVREIYDMHTFPKLLSNGKYRYLSKEYDFSELPESVQGKSGRGWRDVGYHNIICRDATLHHGRDLAIPGAHARGHNKNSIAICLIGGVDSSGKAVDNFEIGQKDTLRGYLDTLTDVFPGSAVVGHRDLSPDLNADGIITPNEYMKQCPCFDVKEWYYG